jgi:hypothetical protein
MPGALTARPRSKRQKKIVLPLKLFGANHAENIIHVIHISISPILDALCKTASQPYPTECVFHLVLESQLIHKTVNLSFISTDWNIKLTIS